MVSFYSRGMVNMVIVLFLAQFPQNVIYFTPLFFQFFVVCSNYDVRYANIRLFVLDSKVNSWSCYLFWWFIRWQVICTAPYRWFYVIVHACCFAPEKVLTNTLELGFIFLVISHPLRCFTILFPMTNIGFSLFVLWSRLFFEGHNYYPMVLQLRSNFIEITLRYGCSPVNLLHIFRTPFTKNTLNGCFWS